jgi:hypothetical protein
MGNSPLRPELVVKFWPPSISAKGVEAIEAFRRPMAFAVYTRPVVAIVVGLAAVWEGKSYFVVAFRVLKNLF